MTLYDLLQENIPNPPKYESGISFLDEALEGGFEMGQLVTITGEQEAGKTMLINQILANVAQGHKCLYFSLEFNKRQLQKNFAQRIKQGGVKLEATKNIEVVTTDMTDGLLASVLAKIEYHIKQQGVKFIGIDSTLMLYIEELGGEAETTEIFRRLQKITVENDTLIFVITQGSKEDNKEGRISIFGSQKANHFANMMLHLTFDREEDKRYLIIAKNKQNGRYLKQRIYFNPKILAFTPHEIEFEDAPKPTNKVGREKKKKDLFKDIL
jgi:predicted ATP-dependent serine protease